jgi:hypothetical protein
MLSVRSSSLDASSTYKEQNRSEVVIDDEVQCVRCKIRLSASFLFCVNCGLRRAPSNPETEVVDEPLKTARKVQTPAVSVKKSKTKKQAPRINASNALSLPKEIVDAIENKLSEPILNNTIIARRLAQQYQTQVLELQNAEGVETVAHIRFSESLALNTNSVDQPATSVQDQMNQSTVSRSQASAAPMPSTSTGVAGKINTRSTSSKTKKKATKTAKTAKSTEYLSNVESVSTHYALYMSRLKQLEGLRAALMDPPPLISEVLKTRDSQKYDSAVTDLYSRIVASSVGLLADADVESAHEVDTFPYPAAESRVTDELPAQQGSQDAPENTDHSAGNATGGMAFMWGPIFNPDASEAIAAPSIHGASFLAEGVVRLDSSTVLEGSPNNSAKGSRASTPLSASFRPISPTIRDANVSPAGSGKRNSGATSPSPAKSRTAVLDAETAPVVMFWGNALGSEPPVADTTDPRFSRTSSFRTSPFNSYHSRATSPASSAASSYASMQEAAEAELPVWIEALAAETAGIREDFYAEDARIMRKLDARLAALDAGNMRQMSRRALMVQYSMDGVVREYWEKIKHMKANLTLTPASPSRSNADEEDELSDGGEGEEKNANHSDLRMSPVSFLRSGFESLEDEEQRAVEEEEERAAPEASQTSWGDVPVAIDTVYQDQEVRSFPTVDALHRSVVPELRGSLTMDRGQIFEVIEEQESNIAEARQHAQVDDEVLMQDLILSLTSAHQKRFGGEQTVGSTGGESTVSASTAAGDLAERGTEARIRERLHLQEQQEAAESELRNRADEADEVAMKQWLVAVTAADAERARKQTLRTLQMEEMEDGGEDSDDDEASVSSSVQARAASADGGELVVPENHSLHKIKAVYRQSCSKMLALLPELEVDFTVDQTEHSEFRTEARSKVFLARKVLKASTAVDHKAALEYRAFLDHCALRRAAQAMKLSDAMRRASELEKSYRERYAEATREFKGSADAMLADTSDTAKQVTSSKHMRAIQKSAELDIAQQGLVVKALQADEAKLLLDIRYFPHGLWQKYCNVRCVISCFCCVCMV